MSPSQVYSAANLLVRTEQDILPMLRAMGLEDEVELARSLGFRWEEE